MLILRDISKQQAQEEVYRYLQGHGGADELAIADALELSLEDACDALDELQRQGRVSTR